jgi:hypothetical protein
MPAEREQQLPVLAGPGYAEQHDARLDRLGMPPGHDQPPGQIGYQRS